MERFQGTGKRRKDRKAAAKQSHTHEQVPLEA
jgi:hypothetical protein